MSDSTSPLALPENANLHWLKNRATDRLRELRLVDSTAERAAALRDVARSYGFASWAKLKVAVTNAGVRRVREAFREAVQNHDAVAVDRLLGKSRYLRNRINDPLFAFDSPAVVAAGGDPAVIDVLLRHGADINRKSKWWAGGFGVLDHSDPKTGEHLVSRGAKIDVFGAAALDRVDLMRPLLDTDPALVHARGGDGGTALHFARSIEMIDFLLDRGALIDARDRDHEATAAQWMMPRIASSSSAFETGSIERVRHLVKCGAAVDSFMAAAIDDVSTLAHWIDIDPRALQHRVGDDDIPLCPKAPGEHKYVYSLVTGTTLIDVAAGFSSTRCLELIRSRLTPHERFVMACSMGDRATADALRRVDPAVAAPLTDFDQQRLSASAWAGRLDAVKLMLDSGFDPACVSPQQGTALHAAAWHGRANIVAAVLEHPATHSQFTRVVAAVEPQYQATAMGWCCHGSLHCRNPAGDYAQTARLLLEAGAERPGDLSNVSVEIRALLESMK